jgi:hypothetical protein
VGVPGSSPGKGTIKLTKMTRYITPNGLNMIKCYPLNWQVENVYAAKVKYNPEYYSIAIGSIDQMWKAIIFPETMILSFSSVSYSHDEVYRFKVETLEEASELVLKFAKGMGRLDDLVDTIYWN